MLNYRVLEKKDDKETVREDFLSFFNSVYQKKPDSSFWYHQVSGSPYSDSPLFLALDGENIIGSALMILQKCNIEDKRHDCYLFTTSAILKEYRANGVYAKLLNLQKEYARKKDVDFIFSFPNLAAYPVLKFFGGFKDLQIDNLVKTTLNDLNLECVENSLIIDSCMFEWRFEHKDYKFYNKNGVVIVYKKYDNIHDILGMYKQEEFQFLYANSMLEDSENITTLNSCLKSGESAKAGRRINCVYYPINKDINYSKIKINLLMSDVF
jgi:hypothetical protein